VELDSLADQLQNLAARFSHCNASGQVWHISAETGLALLDDYQELHGPS
jgi:hypothetical protein